MRKSCGIIVEDCNRKLLICNSVFCDIFNIPISPEKMVGEDCSKSVYFVKHLFIDSEKFINDIDKIILDKKPIIGEYLYMVDGRILLRDYIPIFSGDKYIGHTWQYYLQDGIKGKLRRFLRKFFLRRFLRNVIN